MLKTLILEGRMAKKFGREHKFHVEDLREMLRAMCSQVPGFKRYLSEGHMQDPLCLLQWQKQHRP